MGVCLSSNSFSKKEPSSCDDLVSCITKNTQKRLVQLEKDGHTCMIPWGSEPVILIWCGEDVCNNGDVQTTI